MQPQNEYDHKNVGDLINEENPKNEENLKIKPT